MLLVSFSKKLEKIINLLRTRLSIIDVHTSSNQPFNESMSLLFLMVKFIIIKNHK